MHDSQSLIVRIDSLSGHPMHRLLQDQLTILDRVRTYREQGILPDDPLYEFETELMQWDENHLQECINRWVDVIESNIERDASTQRAVQNVRDFGALGDGVHDDAPAIRQAIAATAQHGNGATLHFRRDAIVCAEQQ
jgi:hypothetical protein